MTGHKRTSLDKLVKTWCECEQKRWIPEVRREQKWDQWPRGSDSDSNNGQMNRLIARDRDHYSDFRQTFSNDDDDDVQLIKFQMENFSKSVFVFFFVFSFFFSSRIRSDLKKCENHQNTKIFPKIEIHVYNSGHATFSGIQLKIIQARWGREKSG